MERLKGLGIRRPVVSTVFFCALATPLLVLTGCEQWTRMEENQVKLQAMVAANARQLATISSQVHVGQAKLTESIGQVDESTREVAAEVRAVQNEQVQLRDTVITAGEQLDGRMTELGRNQDSLENGVAQVADVTQRTAADVTALARENATLQQTVAANQQELTGRMSAVASNQQRIQTGINHLQQGHEHLAGSVAAVSDQQTKLHQALEDSNSRMTAQLAALAGGHDQIQADIADVQALGQTMTANITGIADEQSALHGSLMANHQELDTRLASLSQGQQDIQAGIDTVGAKADQMHTGLADMESSLHKALRDNHESTTTQIAGLSQDQERLQAGVDALNSKSEHAATEFAAATSSLQESLRANQEALAGQLTSSLQNQHGLQATARDLDVKMDALSGDLAAVATGQTTIQETLRTNHDAVFAGLKDISQNQSSLSGSVAGLTEKADAVVASQDAIGRTMQEYRNAIDRQAAQDAERQQAVQDQLDILTATISQTALDIVAFNTRHAALQQALQAGMGQLDEKADQIAVGLKGVAEQQSVLQRSVAAGNEGLGAQATALAQTQQDIRAGVNGLRETVTGNHQALSDQMATGLVRMAAAQASMDEAVKGQTDAIHSQTAGLADMRESMDAQFDILTATAGQTTLDMLTLGASQTKLAQTVRTGMTDLGGQMDGVSDNQEQIRTGLDVLTATAGQAQLDLINMAARQDALHQAVQGHDAAAAGQMAQLADHQQQIRSSLDAVKSTAGQAVVDVGTLNSSQSRMEQAMQAGRDELMTRLAEIAQGQQNWLQRFDAAQANVDTMAKGISTLEQQVARLQGTLQTSIQELMSHLDTEAQKRVELEAQVSQDFQAVIESLSQLRRTQTSLQEQMAQTQVQRNPQSQTRNAAPAPEPGNEQPAEVKVSDAGVKVEAPVPEATK